MYVDTYHDRSPFCRIDFSARWPISDQDNSTTAVTTKYLFDQDHGGIRWSRCAEYSALGEARGGEEVAELLQMTLLPRLKEYEIHPKISGSLGRVMS